MFTLIKIALLCFKLLLEGWENDTDFKNKIMLTNCFSCFSCSEGHCKILFGECGGISLQNLKFITLKKLNLIVTCYLLGMNKNKSEMTSFS